ncbi:methyltransferase domain-containing protein [Pseudonocardia sp. ICBG601]|uniref:class I SAM-dependent methyltransferase n=1 Tax=Pseudonocardia sp. ICBG601 TaxID=2846759 RepID=UPI001CF6B55E|nr:methyltransferase domain-containing protein [Pseudonocardia sp. ICBG601]
MPRDTYTHGHPGVVVRSHAARTAQDSCAYLLDRLAPGTSLLDVGCGPGSITADLAERVAPGRCARRRGGARPLEQARAGAAARGLDVEFAVDDGYALSDPDDTWDVVHAHQVLQHVSDPVAVAVCCGDGPGRPPRRTGRRPRRRLRRVPLVAARPAPGPLAGAVPGRRPRQRRRARRRTAAARLGARGRVQRGDTVGVGLVPRDPARPRRLGRDVADRIHTGVGRMAGRPRAGEEPELADISAAWREWAAHPDGWLVIPHGEILARVLG